MNLNIRMLLEMRHSPLHNYIVPGLTSWLIGAPSVNGCVRLFECSRNQQEAITPHSHRFDFQCAVLRGKVTNRLWSRDHSGDWFQSSTQQCDEAGIYQTKPQSVDRWSYFDAEHETGEFYSMLSTQVHSIIFSKDARVLFFEGPRIQEHSIILEPHVDGETIPTFQVQPWMFRKGKLPADEQSCS